VRTSQIASLGLRSAYPQICCLLLDVYYLQRNASGPAPTTRVLGTTLRVTLTPKLHPRR